MTVLDLKKTLELRTTNPQVNVEQQVSDQNLTRFDYVKHFSLLLTPGYYLLVLLRSSSICFSYAFPEFFGAFPSKIYPLNSYQQLANT